MKGFLLDENLPTRLTFSPSLPVSHARDFGGNPTDSELWDLAGASQWVIVTKDTYRADHGTPVVSLAPLPSCAQFLNVIESVFSGMARAIIHNSNYESVDAAKAAIDRYFTDRNKNFKRTHDPLAISCGGRS